VQNPELRLDLPSSADEDKLANSYDVQVLSDESSQSCMSSSSGDSDFVLVNTLDDQELPVCPDTMCTKQALQEHARINERLD